MVVGTTTDWRRHRRRHAALDRWSSSILACFFLRPGGAGEQERGGEERPDGMAEVAAS